ncbi:MAG: Asp-tRNA(Asn)/Glu-tRNA(Gln) amidotransferase subunit GatA [Elusimicrobiota bacterium]
MSRVDKIRKSILSGEMSAGKVLESSFKKIKSRGRDLNCWISLNEEYAYKKASEIDAKVKKGIDPGPLCGVPVGIKDNMLIEDLITSCASKMLKNYRSPYTATAVRLLEEAGAVIVGKTNMDEFAMGSSGESSFFGPALNPFDPERTPGGSSSGSAAAVADSQVPVALGSDTGGSVRQPAAFCGLVGFKPTYGLVSRYGLVPFASSLDQIAPFASEVKDCAYVLGAIAGYDSCDSTSIKAQVPDYLQSIEGGVKGLKIGIPQEYLSEGIDAEVKERFMLAVEKLKDCGALLKNISLEHTSVALSVYYILAPAEASANLARFDGLKFGLSKDSGKDIASDIISARTEGFGSEVKRRIMLGTYVLSSGYYDAYYIKAQKVRSLIKKDFENAFNEVDVVFAPTTPGTAFKLGEMKDNILKMYLSDKFTVSANLAGIPAVNVPLGNDSGGLPVGAQLMGAYLSEDMLFRAAEALEKEIDK